MRGRLVFGARSREVDLKSIPRTGECVWFAWDGVGRSVFRVDDVTHEITTGVVAVYLR